MSVLPNSATFASFFIVLALLLTLTLSPSIYHTLQRRLQSFDISTFNVFGQIKIAALSERPTLLGVSNILKGAIPEALINQPSVSPPVTPSQEESRLVRYLQALKPHSKEWYRGQASFSEFRARFPKPVSFYYLFLSIFWEIPNKIAWCYLVPELRFPLDQWVLYVHRDNRFVRDARWKWHPLAFIRDIVRALILPCWGIIVLAILVWLGSLLLLKVIFLLLCLPVVRIGACFGWI